MRKTRTLKAVRADIEALEKSAEVRNYTFVNDADRIRYKELRAEEEGIKVYRAEKAVRRARRNTAYKAIYEEANEAGLKAGREAIPTPMVVQQHANQLDDNSEVVKNYYVSEGACGFAWVNIKDRKFGKWVKDIGYGDTDSYYGGVTLWCKEFGQSITRKIAWAGTVAEVLAKYGIDCYSDSRLD